MGTLILALIFKTFSMILWYDLATFIEGLVANASLIRR